MTTLTKILVTLFLSAFLVSCNFSFNGIKGKGEVIRKEKTITDNFNAVKASRGLDVVLLDRDDQKVIIEANENLHDHIQVSVKGDVLHVTSDTNIYMADEKTVYVSYQKLDKISSTSGAHITSEEALVQQSITISATSGSNIQLRVKAENLKTSVTSGAFIDLTGKVNNHNASATSGANIRANELLSLVTEAKATSGANIKIHAKNEFTGKATSGANVVYYGNPQTVSENDNSGGSVTRK